MRIPFGHRKVRGIVVALRDGATEGLETVAGKVTGRPVMPTPELFEWIATRYVTPRGRAYARAVPPRVRVPDTPPPTPRATLAPDLLIRYEGGADLVAALRTGGTGTFCVRALLGEDRGRLIAELVAAVPDGGVIVTVPEVRYGSKILDGVARHLGPIGRLDSARPDKERAAAWLASSRGQVISGGGRSAVLAPCDPLRLIVVDEEHHHTYKEDRAPRYDACRVAVERARIQHAVCVLVSPCPRVETGAGVRFGEIAGVVPTREARRAARPVIELVERPEDRSLSHQLHERVAAELRSGARVALLAPSGTFARAVWCASCRRSLRCPQCEAGLSYARSEGEVRCPRCGYRDRLPGTCPNCGERELRFVGAGTERLLEQLTKTFPRARVARVDPEDPSSVPDDVEVYVTTWIGTKPELRPDVSLVGVLDADWLIRRPDLRSAETAHQALVEMAEWAGPADGGGRLVIQTSDPGHHAIQAVVRGDYDFFLERELEIRKELLYPPYAELVRILATGPAAAETLSSIAAQLRSDSVRVLGPVGAPPPRRGSQALLKCHDARAVAIRLRDILPTIPRDVRVSVDVDPR